MHALQGHPHARRLGERTEPDRLVRLQTDRQPVRTRTQGHRFQRGVLHRPEVDDNLGDAAREPLAGAQKKRHTLPTPDFHLDFQRDESLGRTTLPDTGLRVIRRYCRVLNGTPSPWRGGSRVVQSPLLIPSLTRHLKRTLVEHSWLLKMLT